MPTRQVALVARHPFPFRGQWIATGERLLARPVDARVLVQIRHAVYAADAVGTDVVVAPDPAQPKAKRLYRRRDQTAENVGSPAPSKRTYRRRDLAPED